MVCLRSARENSCASRLSDVISTSRLFLMNLNGGCRKSRQRRLLVSALARMDCQVGRCEHNTGRQVPGTHLR
jgi:hypothetical protein